VHEQRRVRQQVGERDAHRIGGRANGVDDADGEVGWRRQGLAEMCGSPAANTIVSVQAPPTSVATMYLRIIL
jgi:hypothetical protein